MPFRCSEKACGRKRFSTRTRSVMECSKVRCRDWLLGLFLLSTSLRGVSRMRLHWDLGVNPKTAWFLAHRIRTALSRDSAVPYSGPVEVDETYVGGKRQNMAKSRRKNLTGRGPAGKAGLVGARDRQAKQVPAKLVRSADKETLQCFVNGHAAQGATECTDDASAYETLPLDHHSFKCSLHKYVRGTCRRTASRAREAG